MFFRRTRSTQISYEADLQGIDPKSSYEVSFAETYDVRSKRVVTGRELAHLHVDISQAPGSLLVRYRKTGSGSPE
jgi:hypothetical protein